MFAFIISLFLLSLRGGNAAGFCNVEGYYWRDFTGDIPEDALPGGEDEYGKPIYIGQILNLVFLIPAKIYSTDSKVLYEYGGFEHTAKDNIKILCTQHPKQFEWIRTNNEDIKLLTDKHLVIGGYEPGATTYIGREQSGGEIAIGKALTDNFPHNAGLHISKDGRGHRHTSFEVLTYIPYAK